MQIHFFLGKTWRREICAELGKSGEKGSASLNCFFVSLQSSETCKHSPVGCQNLVKSRSVSLRWQPQKVEYKTYMYKVLSGRYQLPETGQGENMDMIFTGFPGLLGRSELSLRHVLK